jgi:lambda family phage minor tail protein L
MTNSASSAINRPAVGGPALSGLVQLFTIAQPNGELLRFTTAPAPAGHVAFDGQRFISFPLAAKGFRWSADGPPARPTIEISNIHGLFDLAVSADQLRGLEVQRILTLASELAPPDGTDGGSSFPVESWLIDRIARLDDRIIRIELAAAASLENRSFPERVMLRDLCQHRYRRWDPHQRAFDYTGVTCPYVGTRYFTANGAATSDAAADVCSLSLATGCRYRFSDVLPFLGFPGVTRA